MAIIIIGRTLNHKIFSKWGETMLRKFIIVSFLFLLPLVMTSCDSNDSSGNVVIQGLISNSSQFGNMTAIILEGNSRLGRTNVDSEGRFIIGFVSKTGVVTLRFESSTFNAERPNIPVINNSTTTLDITLQQNPILIVFDRWQVFQDPISFSKDQSINYSQAQAELNIDGNRGDCIFAGGTSVVNYSVKSISITNCSQAIRAQSSGSVILNANEGIEISSNRDAITTLNAGFVEVGQTLNPVNNTITIQSNNQYGITASGNSIVDINPQNSCSISGSKGAVNVSGSASVDTSTCTLSNQS